MNRILHIVFFSLLFCLPSAAQGRFPVLARDPAVSVGVFGNGMQWFVVENPSFASEGEVALLQRACQNAQDSLPASLDATFLGSLGIAPGKCGYVGKGEGYRTYRFRSVPTGAALDSLLSRLCAAASSCDPSCQAIIVAGDVKKAEMAGKLKAFAGVASRPDSSMRAEVDSVHRGPAATLRPEKGRRTVTFRAESGFPGLSRDLMGTVVSSVSSRMDHILAVSIEKTLAQMFVADTIPFVSVKADVCKTVAEGGDDVYGVEIVTSPEYVGAVAERTGRLMRAFERDGLSLYGFGWMSDIVMTRFSVYALSPVGNSAWVDRCILSALRGADLASAASKYEYFNSRAAADSVRLRHFNRFVRALVGNDPKLKLSCTGATGQLDADSLLALYRAPWEDSVAVSFCRVNLSDTLGFVSPARKKIKAKEKPDPVLGGVRWDFKNGTKALYKRMPRCGRVNYSYIFRTGAGAVPGIRESEAPYLGDMFPLCSFGALSGQAFLNLLEANGITMKCRVSRYDVRLEGSAPANRIHLLMKALVAATSPTAPSDDAVAMWLASRNIEDVDTLALARRTALRRLHPGFSRSMERIPEDLDGSLAVKAYFLFNACFSRSEDAMLVLIGEQPESHVLKYLRMYMGDFRTGGRRLPAGGATEKTLSSSAKTSGPGPEGSALVALSAAQTLNADNYAETAVAGEILRRRIKAATAGSGYVADVRAELTGRPLEAVNVMVVLERADLAGLPGVEERMSPKDVVEIVRDELARLAQDGVGEEELAAVRSVLATDAVLSGRDREHLLDLAAIRFVEMRDLVSGYPGKIKAVTKESVDGLFKMLDSCGRVEYISDNR